MSEVAERPPALSVFELTMLFADTAETQGHPTVELIVAICEQVDPRSNRDLMHAMFGVPTVGALPREFADRLTEEQAGLIDLGLAAWRKQRLAV